MLYASGMSLRADVAVIGGGVIGCSVAFHLARAGVDIILIEGAELGSGTSAACDGFLSLQSKLPGPHLELAREGLRLFPALSELEPDIELAWRGGLVLARTASQREALSENAAALTRAGVPIQLLEVSEARELEPALSPRLAGASFCPLEGQVNPINLTLALAAGAAAAGARLITGLPVTGIGAPSRGYRLLQTSLEPLRARTVVLAAGLGNVPLAASLGWRAPIAPLKGQLLVTEPVEPLFSRTLAGADYLEVKHGGKRTAGLAFTAEQTASGNVLLGSTREADDASLGTTPDALASIARNAGRYLPSLGRLAVIRSWAGLRPQTPDGLPLIGQIPETADVFIAGGHSGDGIALAPITGRMLTGSILTGKPSALLTPFSPARFD
jgi:sarcosine oxidase subunit beta